MKLPRDLSSDDLIKRLSVLGYEITRQTGSHIRLTTQNIHEKKFLLAKLLKLLFLMDWDFYLNLCIFFLIFLIINQ